ncbi:MAG TPA: sulfotransferase [Rhizomicrobium sp.]|jgi:tetratricopeptide (TPR) repeat protein
MTTPLPVLTDIDAALRAGRLSEALDLARAALASGTEHPLLLGLRARWHEDNGRPSDATADLDRALGLSPNDPVLLTALSRCLATLGRFVRSADAARAALRTAPSAADAHFQLGFALEQLGELDSARRSYTEATRFDPNLAEARARLAALAARRGDWREARILAAQALALAPGNLTARFARIMADLAESRFDRAEADARPIAENARTVPQARATAWNFLGDALDGQSRAPDAFAAYTRSNATLQALWQPRFAQAETGNAIALRLTTEFTAIDAGAWRSAPTGETRPAPIFVLGFPRSGTTLLAEVLAGHPDLSVLDEKPLLADSIFEFTTKPGGLARLAAATPDELTHWRALYWRRAEAAGVITGRLVDKAPLDSLHLPLIARLFPDARIVLALRDPREVVFACFRRLFALTPYLYEFLTLEGTAAFYDTAMRLVELYRTALPLSVLELRNEDLVANPGREIARLCAFLDLEPADAMGDFTRRGPRRAAASPGAANLAGGIGQSVPAIWRRYETELAAILPLLDPWLARFGYADPLTVL